MSNDSTRAQEHRDPFGLHNPPSLSVRESDSSLSMSDLERYLRDETILRIEIVSSTGRQDFAFYLPVSLMIQRELDMRAAAVSSGISRDRWCDSLLYREWRYQMDDDASSRPTAGLQARQSGGEKTLRLDPERDCAASNHSQSFVWHSWLTTCIRAYYNTQSIRIPDECIGSDILLALEYFGIFYTPEQLTFDSFGAYLRVKLWSDYFTHRSRMADWVVQKLLNSNSRHSHSFVTSADPQEGPVMVGCKRADILDGGLTLDASKYDEKMPSCRVVYDFFNDDEQPQGGSGKLDALMRDDFRAYVQHSLPGTDVIFTIRNVTVQRAGVDVITQRAVVHIDFVSKSPSHSAGSPTGTLSVDAPRKTLAPTKTRKAKTVGGGTPERRLRGMDNLKSSPSVDHIYAELANTPTPSDEVRLEKKQPIRPFSNTPSDERCVSHAPKAISPPDFLPQQMSNDDIEHNPLAPIQNIDLYEDFRTVTSGLTGPWLEDDHQVPSTLMADLTGIKHQNVRPGLYSPEPPKIKNSFQQPPPWSTQERHSSLLDSNTVQVERANSASAFSPSVENKPDYIQQFVERATGNSFDSNHSTVTFQEIQGCGADMFTSIYSLFESKKKRLPKGQSGSTTLLETQNESDIKRPNQALQPRPKSVMSHVEKFLPEYGLPLEASNLHTQGEPDVTLESVTTEWFRNAFDLERYLFDHPSPNPQNVEPIQLQCWDGSGRMSPEAARMRFSQTIKGNQPAQAPSPVRVMDFADVRAQKRVDSPSKSGLRDPAAESSPQRREHDLEGNQGGVLPSTSSDAASPNLEVKDENVIPPLTPPKVKKGGSISGSTTSSAVVLNLPKKDKSRPPLVLPSPPQVRKISAPMFMISRKASPSPRHSSTHSAVTEPASNREIIVSSESFASSGSGNQTKTMHEGRRGGLKGFFRMGKKKE